MSDWGWVAFGYLTTYVSLVLYAAWTMLRIRRVRDRLEVR